MKTTDIFSENIVLQPLNTRHEVDHEVQMAKSDLYRAGKSAMALHNMLKNISEQQGLEGWVQAKITKAADYLESVYHYLDYEMKDQRAEVEMEAAPVAPGAVPAAGTSIPGNPMTVNPANAALEKQKAAAAVALQKKQIQDQIKATQKQLQDLQRQMQTVGSLAPMAENTAGAIASSIGSNGMGKKKKEIGSLFGGTFKQDAAEGVDPRNRPVPQINVAMARAKKIPNSKVIKLGPDRGYVVVDRSDPRPEVKPDLTVLGDVSKADERYRQLLRQMRKLENEYNTSSPGKPELRTANVQNMLKNTNYRELSKEKQKMMAIIKQHKDQPRHTVDQGVAESANTLFDVKVIDPKTGDEKTMEISALTATEAKSKVAGKTVEVDGERKHYKVISVKSAWNEAANPAQQAAIAIAKKKSGKYDKEGKRIREDDDLNRVVDIRNRMNAATDPAEKSRLQQQYDMVTSTFNRIPPTSFPATDQATKQAQPTSEAGAPKFTGYYKGTDKGKPGKKMVGGD
jgi:hypothetical protein